MARSKLCKPSRLEHELLSQKSLKPLSSTSFFQSCPCVLELDADTVLDPYVCYSRQSLQGVETAVCSRWQNLPCSGYSSICSDRT